MSNYIKRIAKGNNRKKANYDKFVNAIIAYVDYMVAHGAKEVHIDTDKKNNTFSIHTDNGLTEEQINSAEFQMVSRNLMIALSTAA